MTNIQIDTGSVGGYWLTVEESLRDLGERLGHGGKFVAVTQAGRLSLINTDRIIRMEDAT